MKFQEEIDSRQLSLEVKSKKELMKYEFELAVMLQNQTGLPSMKDQYMEDRKDNREDLKMQNKSFESKGNDSLNRGINLGSHEPR
jgi:hypothetical protein